MVTAHGNESLAPPRFAAALTIIWLRCSARRHAAANPGAGPPDRELRKALLAAEQTGSGERLAASGDDGHLHHEINNPLMRLRRRGASARDLKPPGAAPEAWRTPGRRCEEFAISCSASGLREARSKDYSVLRMLDWIGRAWIRPSAGSALVHVPDEDLPHRVAPAARRPVPGPASSVGVEINPERAALASPGVLREG